MELKSLLGFLGRVTITHFVTYFIFGIVFSTVLGYHELFARPGVASYARQFDDPLLLYGPLVQLVRGPVLALALFPFRKTFFKRKRGWALLWGVLVILQIIVAPSGLIENLIYTKIPTWFQMIMLPEVVTQLLVFSTVLYAWEQRAEKKLTVSLSAIFFVLLVILILGVLSTS